jgi:hypothetical protein
LVNCPTARFFLRRPEVWKRVERQSQVPSPVSETPLTSRFLPEDGWTLAALPASQTAMETTACHWRWKNCLTSKH